ncbi:glycosyl transferase [Halioglobus japonicus]|uniref:Glycosyltransferase family 2 protein n=1 Tax=Halioglobus japonicus TaxID=930805 RepID=A0AAP8SPH8_9GAMM|nr:glycosyltransferase family 2 protein [Halioglobus japonicus]AQA19759.1 glycosyl transferase [Halioglobus japonicus]PLW87168.1 glycosyltransferase family 2 protein [Halioglobus japonicus]GHD09866.1 glycosyl transferase [Halioglobus japonicus]
MDFSIVIPAKDEEQGLAKTLPLLREKYPETEIIVVNDGSTDGTLQVCEAHGVRVVTHPYPKGNGAAIKSGARAARGEHIVFMDGDGQHNPADIERLLYKVEEGYDMVVGARGGIDDQASLARWSANSLYNWLASWMVNRRIHDLTSGFRVVNRKKFLSFLYLLPNGFSYPTTSTMAFFRAGYSVGFVPISVAARLGKSHINLVRDGVRFFLIIFKIGTLYSPLKIYFPTSMLVAGLGVMNYLLGSISSGGWRFTNMSTLLILAGMVVFLMGLLAEQLTNLQYKDAVEHDD